MGYEYIWIFVNFIWHIQILYYVTKCNHCSKFYYLGLHGNHINSTLKLPSHVHVLDLNPQKAPFIDPFFILRINIFQLSHKVILNILIFQPQNNLSILKGETKKTYQSFFTITRSNFTQILSSWTFLNSSSSWLLKNVQDHWIWAKLDWVIVKKTLVGFFLLTL